MSREDAAADVSRLAAPIVVIFFMWGFGTGALWVARPLFVDSLGGSLFQIGLVSSFSAMPRLLSGPVTGLLSDRWGRRPMLILGAAAHGAILVAQFFSGGYVQFALLELLAGVGIAFWTVSSGILIADLTKVANRGRGVGLRDTAMRLGMLGGPLVGGLIAAQFELRWVFIFIASTKIPAIFVVLFIIPETRPRPVPRPAPAHGAAGGIPAYAVRTGSGGSGRESAQTGAAEAGGGAPRTAKGERGRAFQIPWGMFRSKEFGALAVATFSFGMIGLGPGIFRTYYPIHAQDTLMLAPDVIGNLVAAGGVLTMLTAMPTGMAVDRFGRRGPLVAGLLLLGAAVYLLGASEAFVAVAVAVGVFAAAEGMNTNTLQTYAMDLAPADRRGVFLSAFHVAMNLGMMTGPLVAGLLAGRLGLPTTLLVFAGLVAGAALLFALTARETLRRE